MINCDICKGSIEQHRDALGQVYWSKGHNAWPLGSHDDARCCDACNTDVMIARIRLMTEQKYRKLKSLTKESATCVS